LLDTALQLQLICYTAFSNSSPVFYGIIGDRAGLLQMELGLRVVTATRHNDEVKGVQAIGTELPFVGFELLAVAFRLHVYGSAVWKRCKIPEN
jgi:hypothetical protein